MAELPEQEDAQAAIPEDIGHSGAVAHVAKHHRGHGIGGEWRRPIRAPKRQAAILGDVAAQRAPQPVPARAGPGRSDQADGHGDHDDRRSDGHLEASMSDPLRDR